MLKYIKKTVVTETGEEKFLIGYDRQEYEVSELKLILAIIREDKKKCDESVARLEFECQGNIMKTPLLNIYRSKLKALKEQELLLIWLNSYLEAKAKGFPTEHMAFSEIYFDEKATALDTWRTRNGFKPTTRKALERRLAGDLWFLNLIKRFQAKNNRCVAEDYETLRGVAVPGEPLEVNYETVQAVYEARKALLEARVKKLNERLAYKSDLVTIAANKIDSESSHLIDSIQAEVDLRKLGDFLKNNPYAARQIITEFPDLFERLFGSPVRSATDLLEEENAVGESLIERTANLTISLDKMGSYSSLTEDQRRIYDSLKAKRDDIVANIGAVEYAEKSALLKKYPAYFDALAAADEVADELEAAKTELAMFLSQDLTAAKREIIYNINWYNKGLKMAAEYKEEISKSEAALQERGASYTRKYRPSIVRQ